MLLAIDIGNTNVVVGLYDGKTLQDFWRLETSQRKSADEYAVSLRQMFIASGFDFSQVDAVIVSTVVPPLAFTMQHLCEKYFNLTPIMVEPGLKTGLIVKYDNPKLLGSDRIVNSVAALTFYEPPLIVIDFGTATTICALSDKHEFLGGTIAPGMKTCAQALFEKTAQLPRIELEKPKQFICRNTASCMQSGVVNGHIGLVEYLVNNMKREIKELTGCEKKVTVVATGGYANIVADNTNVIDVVNKELTLAGLQLIYEKNK